MLKRHQTALRVITVATLIALVLFLRVDLGETVALLARANVWLVALALLGFVPFLAIKAFRWQVILRDLGVSIRFAEALRLYALGLGAGMITPGNVGDAIKVAYFRERGLSQAVLSVVLDRVWDVLILLLLAGSGVFLFSQIAVAQWLMLGLITLGTVALLGVTIHPRTQALMLGLFMRLRKKDAAVAAPAPMSARQVLVQFGLSVLATAVVYARLFCVAAALSIFLPPLPFVAAMSLASIAQLIAIAPFGLGPREGVLLLLAPALGVTGSQALALSALLLVLQVENGVVGLVVWLLERPSERVSTTAAGLLSEKLPTDANPQ